MLLLLSHTVAKSKFLSKNSNFMEYPAILNLNFDAKNEIIQNFIFLNKKLRFATVCVSGRESGE